MEELRCDDCQAHIGYMNYCGPRGWVNCDSCHELAKLEEQKEQEEDNGT
jgi:hypothetical protein